tara:strand:+ start:1692 stop:2639 length:948 start_codon:yes stop_codon:yes gene_type:complete
MKINPTFSLFCSLLFAFIFGFSLSSSFKLPYETSQSLDILLDDVPALTQEKPNLSSNSDEKINENLSSSEKVSIVIEEDNKITGEINNMDTSILPESDGAEVNVTAFSIFQTAEEIINSKTVPNVNIAQGCFDEDTLKDEKIWHSPNENNDYSKQFFNISIQVESGLNLNPNCLSEMITGILNDPRGWSTIENTEFQNVDREFSDLNIIFAKPDTVDELCYPLQTNGIYSCRNEQNVVINMYRWTSGAKDFDDISTYRIYLINHEVGHYLGWGHTDCPSENALAPVMMQQSKSTGGCIPYGWPIYERVKLLYRSP